MDADTFDDLVKRLTERPQATAAPRTPRHPAPGAPCCAW